MQSFHGDIGGHVHETAFEDNQIVEVTDFDWASIDRSCDGIEPAEQTISLADASAAISIILGWICKGQYKSDPAPIASVASRAEALLLLLDPNQSRYETLADIARASGMTRAAISKSLLSLKDQSGLALTIGKLHGTRDTYREAQRKCVAEGTHSSFRRRDASQKA